MDVQWPKPVFQELCAQGFTGRDICVCLFTRQWSLPQAGACVHSVPKGATQQPRTPWQTKWLLLRAPDELSPQDASYCQAVCHLCPALAQAASLARRFVQMVRQRQHDQFDAWLKASQR